MAPTAIKSAQEVTLHTPEGEAPKLLQPGVFRLETVARASRALKLIEQILQRGKQEAPQGVEKSETS